jgi:hypothetical protein
MREATISESTRTPSQSKMMRDSAMVRSLCSRRTVGAVRLAVARVPAGLQIGGSAPTPVVKVVR